MAAYTSALDCIGNTPLIEFSRFAKEKQLSARLFAKLEMFNPFGSVKDRIALNMIETAEKEGKLRPGSVIIEPTSGNTGIGLAGVAALKGYRTILTMPETMSVERRQLLQAHGAELVLTDGKQGMKGAIAKAEELVKTTEGGFISGQFVNPANPETHYQTTGPEILRDCPDIAAFVAGVGTGGTITGCGRYLKEKNRDIRVIAVEPDESPVLSGGQSGPHKIQGIGAGFVPDILDTSVYDEVLRIRGEDAMALVRDIGRLEGVLVGISSGAALAGAVQIAKRQEFAGKAIVFVAPDTGERYLSTGVFG